jgi:hypothetical protein
MDSRIAKCREHHVDPRTYLRDVLLRIGKVSDVRGLVNAPWRCGSPNGYPRVDCPSLTPKESRLSNPWFELRMRLSAICLALPQGPAAALPQTPDPAAELVFPGLLEKSAREAGNPLATYAAMCALDEQYRGSKVFAAIYPEVRFNYEEFLGLPLAGVEAMSLPALRMPPSKAEAGILTEYEARDAVDVIAAMAKGTRLVIYGEEHHLPQTRSVYERLLRELWGQGYRYLAAEAFTDEVMSPDFTCPRYTSGYYVMDPVFASAVRAAQRLGYRLVAYDTAERGPEGDDSFRDRTQAENIKKRVFDRDPQAKVLVLAGRGHAAEVAPADGWTPMASVLKRITGIDPFTVYAPTMSQRLTPAEEDPTYRLATARDLVSGPTIFAKDKEGRCLGSGNCDAYVFWPRITVQDGRPDWMRKTMGREAVPIPEEFRGGSGLRLIQVFPAGDPASAIPVDQVLLREGEPLPTLMLPERECWIRAIDAKGVVVGPVPLKVLAHPPNDK